MTDFSRWMMLPTAAPAAGPVDASVPMQGAPTGKAGTGFVNPGRILALNQGVGQQMAGQVAQGLNSQVGGMAATKERGMLIQNGGLGTVLSAQYGQSRPYSPGQMTMDAFLAQGSGGNVLKAATAGAARLQAPVATPQPGPESPSVNMGTAAQARREPDYGAVQREARDAKRPKARSFGAWMAPPAA